jgi:hypothetical protein
MREGFTRGHDVKGSSDRMFGLVMAVFFALLGFGPLVRGHAIRWSAVAVSLAFALLALARPATLRPLNYLWMKLGLLLNRVTSPIVLGVLFYLVITPFGLVMRVFGKAPLQLKRDPSAATYWIPRTPSTSTPASMTQQF